MMKEEIYIMIERCKAAKGDVLDTTRLFNVLLHSLTIHSITY